MSPLVHQSPVGHFTSACWNRLVAWRRGWPLQLSAAYDAELWKSRSKKNVGSIHSFSEWIFSTSNAQWQHHSRRVLSLNDSVILMWTTCLYSHSRSRAISRNWKTRRQKHDSVEVAYLLSCVEQILVSITVYLFCILWIIYFFVVFAYQYIEYGQVSRSQPRKRGQFRLF